MALRLTLVAQGATAATRTAGFPRDEPVAPAEIARARALAPRLGRIDAAWTGPGLAATQTAAALGVEAAVDPALRDMDHGTWSGRSLAEVETSHPAELMRWMQDPDFAPPGGDSVETMLARVRPWLAEVSARTGRLLAITHAAWMRAAVVTVLDARPDSFWRIDIAPLATCRFSFDGRRWVVQTVNHE